MDSVGIGETPDADKFDDIGANTLLHISTAKNGLNVPNLERLGLSNIYKLKGVNTVHPSLGYYTKCKKLLAVKIQ